MGRKYRAWLLVAALFAPAAAWGNVPAAYVFVGLFHLVLGCALLGAGEGWLMARVFKLPAKKTIAWMIFANYFSAWVGFVLPAVADFPPSLHYVNAYLWTSIAVYFVLTLILEWPFVFALFKGDSRRVARSIQASLLAQGASYAVLVLLYAGGGWQENLNRFEPEYASWANPRTVVYYLSPDNRTLYRIRLKDAKAERVLELDSQEQPVYLHVSRSSPGSDSLDLWAGGEVILRDAGRLGGSATESPYESCPGEGNYGCAVDLRSGERSTWRIRNEYTRALAAESNETGERFAVGMETVLLRFRITRVTALPEDQVLFQATNAAMPWGGRERPQVCLLDLKNRKLAVVAEGQFPVAFVDVAGAEAK